MNKVILKRSLEHSLLFFFFIITLHMFLASSAEAVDLTGYVEDTANQAIPNAKVIVYQTSVWDASSTGATEADWGTDWAYTDPFGDYSITGLDSGTYKLKVLPPDGYISEWWNNKTNYDNATSHLGGTADFSLAIDNGPPTGSVDIDPGGPTSISYYVTLTLSANDALSDVKQMRFSHDSGATWFPWEPYQTSRNWVLTSIGGQDPKVTVQFKDSAGNVSSEYSDQVLIDGPKVGGVDFSNLGSGHSDDVNGETILTLYRGDRDFTLSLDIDLTCQGPPAPKIRVPIDGVPTEFTLVKQGVSDTFVAEISGIVTEGDIELIVDCLPEPVVIGSIVLIDPSGIISDIVTGDPIEGATVSLYRLNPFTSLPGFMDPAVGLNSLLMEPDLNPQSSGIDGWYGWDVAAGSYYVGVEAEGYYDVDQSLIVTIPPPVTDLDIELTPIVSCIDSPTNMVSWWPLDETSVTVSKSIIGDNDGTYLSYGGNPLPTPVAGKVSLGLQFNGNNGVSVPDHDSLDMGTGDFSVDAWVRLDDATDVKTIMDKRAEVAGKEFGYHVYLWDGRLGVRLADGTNGGNQGGTNYNVPDGPLTIATDGKWHFVGVSVERGVGITYVVDGLPSYFKPLTGLYTHTGNLDNSANLLIGDQTGVGAGPAAFRFDGAIDELEIFNRALDPDELQDIYNASAQGKCKDSLSGFQLPGGQSVNMSVPAGYEFSNVLVDPSPVSSLPGVNFPFGTISYSVTVPVGGSVTTTFVFANPLSTSLVLYKVDGSGNKTPIPQSYWSLNQDQTVLTLTLTDGDQYTDLDYLSGPNGVIVDPITLGNPIPATGVNLIWLLPIVFFMISSGLILQSRIRLPGNKR